ncbi:MAG: hypothetical protein QOH01_2041 [Verrucomicrobiota bacterium]|jgi:hypothetical protein
MTPPPDMLQEYLKLTDIVSNFDSSLITVKSWGVTLGLAALGFGFKEKNWGYFLLAIACGISFWTIEFTLKGHQMRYFPRMREIEYQISAEDPTHAPRIDYSWSYAPEMLDPDPKKPPSPKEKLSERPPLMGTPTQTGYYDYQNWVWYRRMFLSHVMFPHVFSIILGGAFTWLGYRKKGRFRHYGP